MVQSARMVRVWMGSATVTMDTGVAVAKYQMKMNANIDPVMYSRTVPTHWAVFNVPAFLDILEMVSIAKVTNNYNKNRQLFKYFIYYRYKRMR